MKLFLEEKGYKVSSTGNASRFDYLLTTIESPQEIEDLFIKSILEELSSSYKVDENAITSDNNELTIIVGQEKL